MFVDEATIQIHAGKGGDGMSSFRREKYVAKGGPDGGDGGDGGSVIARSDNNTDTLSEFRYSQEVKAQDGEKGKKSRAHGKTGSDTIIKVPVGTIIHEGEKLIADLNDPDMEVVIARGGRGGFGNAHFKSSRRQSPRMAELGEPGESKEVRLELKTVADVGLIGLPNAGKSTLLSVVSNAKPKIADYAFTTLTPNLGVATVFENSLVVVDIPGLIEGASSGKGLGIEFLRHIERTKVLLHLIDSTSQDISADFQRIQNELASYEVDLSDKPQIVALTKADVSDEKAQQAARDALIHAGVEEERIFTLSSVAHQGLKPLLASVMQEVESLRDQERAIEAEREEEVPTITLEDDPSAWWIEIDDGVYVVNGEKIGRFAQRTNFEDDEAMRRLRDIFHKQGIDRELARQGVKRGDTVAINGKTFTW